MKKDIECEERMMINEEQYLRIFETYRFYPNARYLDQTNYYFDDEKLSLKNAHHVLRIRTINDSSFELTMKIKGDNGDTELNHSLEKEEALSIISTRLFNNEVIEKEIKKVTKDKIKLITSLNTKRLEVPFDDHLLVIDKNEYSSFIDYDIEVEANNMEDAKKWILYYADKFGVEYKKDYVSKSRRAFNKALNIN